MYQIKDLYWYEPTPILKTVFINYENRDAYINKNSRLVSVCSESLDIFNFNARLWQK